jgi:hypothetical protein
VDIVLPQKSLTLTRFAFLATLNVPPPIGPATCVPCPSSSVFGSPAGGGVSNKDYFSL